MLKQHQSSRYEPRVPAQSHERSHANAHNHSHHVHFADQAHGPTQHSRDSIHRTFDESYNFRPSRSSWRDSAADDGALDGASVRDFVARRQQSATYDHAAGFAPQAQPPQPRQDHQTQQQQQQQQQPTANRPRRSHQQPHPQEQDRRDVTPGAKRSHTAAFDPNAPLPR